MASFISHASVAAAVGTILWIVAASSARGEIPFAAGTGEPNDPYLIATAEQLLAVIEQRVSVNRNESPQSLQTKHFALVADIDLDPNLPGGKVFDNALFNLSTGSLDGRGHRILNLYILPPQTWERPAERKLGPDAVLRNLLLEYISVKG